MDSKKQQLICLLGLQQMLIHKTKPQLSNIAKLNKVLSIKTALILIVLIYSGHGTHKLQDHTAVNNRETLKFALEFQAQLHKEKFVNTTPIQESTLAM